MRSCFESCDYVNHRRIKPSAAVESLSDAISYKTHTIFEKSENHSTPRDEKLNLFHSASQSINLFYHSISFPHIILRWWSSRAVSKQINVVHSLMDVKPLFVCCWKTSSTWTSESSLISSYPPDIYIFQSVSENLIYNYVHIPSRIIFLLAPWSC